MERANRRDYHRFGLYMLVGLLAVAHLLSQRPPWYEAPETAAFKNQSQEDDWMADDRMADDSPPSPRPLSSVTPQVAGLHRNRSQDVWLVDDSRYLRAGRNHCFVVEDLCHSANRWFYRVDPHKHQPDFRLMLMTPGEGSRHDGYLDSYTPSRMTYNQTRLQDCVDDLIPNHIVLYSLYNDMLGEFYTGSLVSLYVLLDEEGIPIESFVRQSKLYLHRMNLLKPLLDSHHLFTNAFRSSSLGDVLELLHDTRCRCLRRVFFCGYSVKGDSTPDQYSSNLQEGTFNLTPGVGSPRGGFNVQNSKTTKVFHRIRNFLREQTILKEPFILNDIEAYRNDTIQRMLATAPFAVGPTPQEWRIIGLAQRSGRRRWRNLPQVLEELGPQMFAQGITLLAVNVEEKDWTPYQQLIRHAALDGLIGIHGAQLTEAIWMKPGSLVVELLPYIPAEIFYGKWTTITSGTTPLGTIFDETDLLHVGYALRRESAPYCYNETLDCWRSDGYPWGDRDFIATPGVVAHLLDLFVARRPTTCGGFGNLSRPEDRIVVYNAPCSDAAEPRHRLEPHHFYWKYEYPPEQ